MADRQHGHQGTELRDAPSIVIEQPVIVLADGRQRKEWKELFHGRTAFLGNRTMTLRPQWRFAIPLPEVQAPPAEADVD